ncbi:MAG: hypothetical protein H0U92_08475, partial [Actinobacteria bacterium]|nr:hypothetical protein [Actinomycetota bacterium]
MNVSDNLRDATYIAIGMGVMGVQRAQVRREELGKQLAEQRNSLEARVTDVRSTLQSRGAEAVKIVSDVIKEAD